MSFDAKLYQATLTAARAVIERGHPDGSQIRLKAHSAVLRAASFGAGIGDSIKLEYIAGALADLALARDNHTSEHFMAMANVFEARASECLLADPVFPINATRATVWRAAAEMMRQVAAGERV